MKGKALVLGQDTRQFLGVIRSLGRAGVEVHIAWHAPGEAASRSRYISKAHTLAPYAADRLDWKEGLTALLRQERFDLVVPCSDWTAVPLHLHRKDLEPLSRIYLLAPEAFETTMDKIKTSALAEAAGVPMPRQTVVRRLEEGQGVPSAFALPVVLKPWRSYNPETPGHERKVVKAYSWEAYHAALPELLGFGPVSVQENFIGEGVGLEFLLKDGEPLLQFQHLRLHEPLHGGTSSYRKSMAVSDELRTAALKLLRRLSYTGVAMVEFKVDPKTGRWVFLEINGRFWGSLPLAVAAGADFPRALFELLVHGKTIFPQDYERALACRHWLSDLGWQWANLRADRSDRTLAARPLSAVILETAANVLSFRERSDTFTLDDPAPGFAELEDIAGEIWARACRGAGRAYLRSPWIRPGLQERARLALKTAKTALFVCKGNICRSPFAAGLASKVLPPGVNVLSAGSYRIEGRPSPRTAIEAAKKWEVDLCGHRSRILTPEAVASSDAVFVFDQENHERTLADFPQARGKLHLLGALNPSGPLFIDDPFEAGPETFERVYRDISAALQAACQK